MGPAELLLEATFTVMRNGGGGDLSEAYKFLKKVRESHYPEFPNFRINLYVYDVSNTKYN